VKFKTENYTILPHTYIIRTESGKRDLFDLLSKDYNIEDDFEQANASRALEGTNLSTYIKVKSPN